MHKLVIAILGKFEGVNPAEYYPCDTQPRDIRRAAEEYKLNIDYQDDVDPGDTEYGEVWHRFNFRPGDNEAVDETISYDELCTIDVSGILPWHRAFHFLSDIGAEYEDIETMGTLGGPANPTGWAPDFPFRMESQLTIDSIRITPMVWNTNTRKLSPPSPATWSRIEQLLQRKSDTWALIHLGSIDLPNEPIKEGTRDV